MGCPFAAQCDDDNDSGKRQRDEPVLAKKDREGERHARPDVLPQGARLRRGEERNQPAALAVELQRCLNGDHRAGDQKCASYYRRRFENYMWKHDEEMYSSRGEYL